MLWIAGDASERRIGEKVASVCEQAGVEVVLRVAPGVDGRGADAMFRELRRQRAARGRAPLRFIGGLGLGGRAVTACALTPKTDGLAGRVVAAPAAVGAASAPVKLLAAAPLLSIVGDRDAAAIRRAARERGRRLLRAGCEASPCELMGTTAAAAFEALDVDDDLVRPMLLTFLRARR